MTPFKGMNPKLDSQVKDRMQEIYKQYASSCLVFLLALILSVTCGRANSTHSRTDFSLDGALAINDLSPGLQKVVCHLFAMTLE